VNLKTEETGCEDVDLIQQAPDRLK